MVDSNAEDPFAWTGATVDGKYRVDALVGEGGFGVVYRAYHLGFGEKVAIKCLRIPHTLVGQERDRFFASFLSEGRLLHQLSKSTAGIVQALDVGGAISPNKTWTPYIVLEWLEGRPLEEDLNERAANKLGGRPLPEALELLDSAARALAMAHEQNVAHRDIKPANLFMAELGGRRTLKVLDFGIAKVITETASMTRAFESTGSSLQAFTPRYGSPEQFSRRFGATGPWTDVFSLALVLVETVSGKSALEGDDASQLFVSSSDTQRRPTLRTVGVQTSDAIEGVLASALAVDPKERYPNAGEFWDALVAATAASLGQDARSAMPRSLQASSAFLEIQPASAPLSSSQRSAQQDAATQLATSSQVPRDFLARPSLTPETRPTPSRVAIAAGAATATFALAAVVGSLMWRGGVSEQPARAPSVSPSPSAKITERSASASAAPGAVAPPPRVDTPLPAPPADSAIKPVHAAAPGVAAREIGVGRISGTDVWFDRFRMLPRKSDANKTFVEAHVSCAEAGMSLCTEAQWLRACEVYPEIGANAAWTLSADAHGFVVRGGKDCSARNVAPGSERHENRSSVCCDRSVGINSSNKNSSFLIATGKKVLAIEKTLNQRDIPGFLALLSETVSIDQVGKPKASVGKLLEDSFKQWPDQWLLSDVCGVSMQSTTVVKRTRRGRVKRRVSSDSWSADCEQIRFRGGEIAVVHADYVFGGNGNVKSISDGKLTRDWSKP